MRDNHSPGKNWRKTPALTARQCLANHDARRAGDRDRLSDAREPTRLSIDMKNGHIVAGHVGTDQDPAVGRNSQILRTLAEAGDDVDSRQAPIIPDPVTGQAVMPPVGTVGETSVWRDFYIRRITGAVEIRGQGGNGLRFTEQARLAGVIKDGHRIQELIDHVEMASVWMKRQMAWTGAGSQTRVRCVTQFDQGGSFPQPIGDDFIDTQVGRVNKAIIGADNDAVRMWCLLPGLVNARSFVLDEGLSFLD